MLFFDRQGAAEQLILYPLPDIRIVRKIVSGSVTSETTALHRDGLGSVRAVTAGTGMRTETSSYRPYGEQSEGVYALNVPEAKGYIGERLDADAGLQYLNARYYDPKLGLFLQPDWWEVTQAGVGTNRYAYSFGDPINGRDPTGHQVQNSQGFGKIFDDIFGGIFGSKQDARVNAEAVAEKMKEDTKAAVQAAVGLTPVGAAKELYDNLKRRRLGGAALAAVGLIPGEGVVGRIVGKGITGLASLSGRALNLEKTYYRSMSRAEFAAVQKTGVLRGGRPGETYFTDQRFRTGDRGLRVQDRLALPQRPEIQVEFKVRNEPNMTRNGTRVAPDYGARGGGREYMTDEMVEVEIINAQPY